MSGFPDVTPAVNPDVDTNLANGEWHRMSPLTPLVRSWRFLVVVLFFVVQSFGDNVVSGDGVPDVRRPHAPGVLLAGGGAVVLAVIALGAGYVWLSWRMTRFRVDGDALELYSGILFRQHRRARIDRLQTVDLAQPFVARLAGLARLTLEVAGGSNSSIALSYLREGDAQALRNHLLAEVAGVTYETGTQAPEAPENLALEVPVTRLILSLVLSVPAITFIVGVVAFVVFSVVTGEPGPLVAVFPAVLGVAGVLWGRFNGGFGFRVATSPDGLRVRHGLLEQRSQTVPPGRVQAVRLSQGPLWRTADWWSVHVNIAGYSGRGDNDAKDETGRTLLPVGSRQEAVNILALVLPDLGVGPQENAWEVVEAALTGTSTEPGGGDFLVSPSRARWLDPISWRRTGVRVTSEALLIRKGRVSRVVDVVPHARTQSIAVTQGPLERRLRIATFEVHSTPGPVSPVVQHLDAVDAARLLADQSVRAQTARASAGPERWMQRLDQPLEEPAETAQPAGVDQFAPPDPERG